MNAQEIYYKATGANGVSGYDPNFTYHLGINIHPEPDRKSNAACGKGIHLAKSVQVAKRLCKGWKEIYEAKTGVILGEDNEKIRCASCMLLNRVGDVNVIMPNRPSLDDEWLEKHMFDVTMEDINNQTLEIIRDKKASLCLKASMRKKDRLEILKYVIGKT